VKDWKEHKLVCKLQRSFPQIPSFDIALNPVVAKGEEDEVAVWVCVSKDNVESKKQSPERVLSFQVITQNFGKGGARTTPDTAHLILHSSKRIKVSKDGGDTKIIAINGTAADSSTRQVSLQTQEHALLQVAFLLDDVETKTEASAVLELKSFVLPVKVDGRGVIKIEANFEPETIKKLYTDHHTP